MTEKLYYQDSHLHNFSACVLCCEPVDNGLFRVVLDRSAFFPEGGGQRQDTGKIGGAAVVDVQERDGEIVHVCDAPLKVGETCDCSVDWEQRYRRMQNHSGEHIVSGIVHNLYGYDNVGFHMGDDCMTIDFSGELTQEQLLQVETLANEKVRENVEIRAWFPEPGQLRGIDYRSKLELTHDVRLVSIEGCDVCACCAPHVSRTGEVGIIKILDFMRHRGGMRVFLTCGMDALDSIRTYQKQITDISGLLSARREKTAEAVVRVLEDRAEQKNRIALISMENVRLRAESTPETEKSNCVFDDVLDDVARRELVNLLSEKSGIMAAVFSGNDEDGYRYIIGSRNVNLRNCAGAINHGISGRGGGTPSMIQGSCRESAERIIQFINNFAPES